MRTPDRRSREIVEIMADVVSAVSADCTVTAYDGTVVVNPEIHYTFGNARYVKDRLDELSKSAVEMKYPLIVLFAPFNEIRNKPDFYTKAKVRVLIACASDKEWSNEQRLEMSFRRILRPIYDRFIKALEQDGRFDFGYEVKVAHEYSENYSYGRYGAYTGTGEEVSDSIDAINISNLELTVKNQKCR